MRIQCTMENKREWCCRSTQRKPSSLRSHPSFLLAPTIDSEQIATKKTHISATLLTKSIPNSSLHRLRLLLLAQIFSRWFERRVHQRNISSQRVCTFAFFFLTPTINSEQTATKNIKDSSAVYEKYSKFCSPSALSFTSRINHQSWQGSLQNVSLLLLTG